LGFIGGSCWGTEAVLEAAEAPGEREQGGSEEQRREAVAPSSERAAITINMGSSGFLIGLR
jgi:hypothetical protein